MNILKEKSVYLILGGIGIGAGLAYLFYKMESSRNDGVAPEEDLFGQLEPSDAEALMNLLQETRQAALVDSGSGNFLQPATIYSINVAFAKKCEARYTQLRREGRTKRRAVLEKDLDEYVAVSNEYSKKIDVLLEKGIEFVLHELGIPEKYWEMSVEQRTLETGRQFGLIGVLMLKDLGSKLPARQPLKKELVVEIMQFQLAQMPFIDLKKLPEEDRSFIFRHILIDKANQRYGVEDQDLSERTLTADPDVKALMNELEDKIQAALESWVEAQEPKITPSAE